MKFHYLSIMCIFSYQNSYHFLSGFVSLFKTIIELINHHEKELLTVISTFLALRAVLVVSVVTKRKNPEI